MAARKKKRKTTRRKKGAAPKRRARPVALKVDAKKQGGVPNRNGTYVYTVTVRGPNGKLSLPNIIARNATEAERVGKRLFKQSVG